MSPARASSWAFETIGCGAASGSDSSSLSGARFSNSSAAFSSATRSQPMLCLSILSVASASPRERRISSLENSLVCMFIIPRGMAQEIMQLRTEGRFSPRITGNPATIIFHPNFTVDIIHFMSLEDSLGLKQCSNRSSAPVSQDNGHILQTLFRQDKRPV